MRWTLLCRVVDNFGDVGFAWRLAADLAGRGEKVRLAIDDARALAWMAPGGAPGVEVVAWDAAAPDASDVLVETFGCGWPEPIAAALAAGAAHPVCVNVEHLSAEPFVARSHGLPSPRFTADGTALSSWFFYPGFGDGTGGLLRETGLLARRRAFGDGRAWLAGLGIERRADERCVSLFCYPDAPVEALLDALATAPTLLLLAAGAATERAGAALGAQGRRGALRAVAVPPLAQTDFDRLLWSADLNVVRGEDSLVRAIWAGAPFVWQAYVQQDGAHRVKVEAFLDAFLDGASPGLGAGVRRLFAAWNGLAGPGARPGFEGIDPVEWAGRCAAFRDRLAARPDLGSALVAFVASKR
jgi:uncharacterized repeat protein (TIGR03837 family)